LAVLALLVISAGFLPQRVQAVRIGFANGPFGKAPRAKARLCNLRDIQAPPLRKQDGIPIVAEVVGDDASIFDIAAQLFVGFGWRHAVLAQKFLRLAMNGRGFGRDGHAVVQKDAEWLTGRSSATHPLCGDFNRVDRASKPPRL
jgi:hypothetical protein